MITDDNDNITGSLIYTSLACWTIPDQLSSVRSNVNQVINASTQQNTLGWISVPLSLNPNRVHQIQNIFSPWDEVLHIVWLIFAYKIGRYTCHNHLTLLGTHRSGDNAPYVYIVVQPIEGGSKWRSTT